MNHHLDRDYNIDNPVSNHRINVPGSDGVLSVMYYINAILHMNYIRGTKSHRLHGQCNETRLNPDLLYNFIFIPDVRGMVSRGE